MSIQLPTSSTEVEDRIKVDVARSAVDSNPYLQNHWILALIIGFGRRIFDFYRDMTVVMDDNFPDTATDAKAVQWGSIYGITQNAATQATGNIAATGTVTSVIAAGTAYTANSLTYNVVSDATITAQTISVSSITRSGSTVTVTTISNHNLASNVPVTIAGAVETDYNVTAAAITVTGLTTFTYQITTTPTTPATGTITAAFTSASVNVLSADYASTTNLILDTPLTLQSPIAGVDDVASVDYGGVTGGADQESIADMQTRYLSRMRDPVAHFNDTAIIDKAKEIAGITRVFVQDAGTITSSYNISSITLAGSIATVVTSTAHNLESGMQVTISGATETAYNLTDAYVLVIDATTFCYIVASGTSSPATGSPLGTGSIPNGQVQVYFTRDNDTSIIPSAADVTTVYNKISEIRPANTSTSSLKVSAPTAAPVDFTFTALSPNTTTMQAAITANLQQFFQESTYIGTDIQQDAYRAIINDTIDTSTGDTVASFTLSIPSGSVTISTGEIAILGTITF